MMTSDHLIKRALLVTSISARAMVMHIFGGLDYNSELSEKLKIKYIKSHRILKKTYVFLF